MKILFTGGGTGGHIFPLVAIAREIRRIYPRKDLEFYYAGPKDELSGIYLRQEDFIIKNITSGKIRRYFSFENFIDILFKIPFGALQSFLLISDLKPDLVFSKGGSGSISVVWAAKVLGVPIFLHESDVAPGLSNQKAANWAKKIFTSFPKTEYFDPEKVMLVGNPIRKEILNGDEKTAGEMFDLTFTKPIFLIMGGSQGAEAINDFVLLLLNKLLAHYEIIHVCGQENVRQVEAEAQVVMQKGQEKYYHPVGFLDEKKICHAYKVADMIISRAGSGSIFEIAAVGKPSILVPLPGASFNHQAKNAYIYSDTGAAMVFEQQSLTPNFFMDEIELLFLHPERLEKMKEAALAFAKPMAARAVAREILEFLMLD